MCLFVQQEYACGHRDDTPRIIHKCDDYRANGRCNEEFRVERQNSVCEYCENNNDDEADQGGSGWTADNGDVYETYRAALAA